MTFHGENSLALYFKWLVDETGEGNYAIPYNIAKVGYIMVTSKAQFCNYASSPVSIS